MYKKITPIRLNVTFNPDRKGNKYTLDGDKWLNRGQLAETLRIFEETGRINLYNNINYCLGSDLEEYQESIKSRHATLTTVNLGNTLEEVLLNFATTCPSKQFSYNVIDFRTNQMTTYIMALYEFIEMCLTVCKFEESGKVVRFPHSDKKVVEWLENNLDNDLKPVSCFELCEG